MASAPPQLPPPNHPAGSPWPIPDAAAFLGISPRHLHRLIDAHKVKSIVLGRRRLVPDSELRRIAAEGV
jgi:excisionase family DNA binding protein